MNISIRFSHVLATATLGVAAAFAFALPVAASAATGLAAAPAPCAVTGSPFLTFTQNISNDPDSGNISDWATDAFTETVNVWVGTDGATYCANATATNATFVTTGPVSPEKGSPLDAGITGTFTGGENYTFPSSLTLNPSYSTTTPTTTTFPDSSTAGFSTWVGSVFTNADPTDSYATYVNTYWLNYLTANSNANGTWTDADPVSGGDVGDIVNAPGITSFTATPSIITAGQGTSVNLAWTTGTSTALSIDNGIGNVTGETSTSTSPTTTTTYTLTASNLGYATTTSTATVTVNPAPSAVYVDPSGSDANAGSQAAPFKTIQAAVNAVASGGTVNVDAGTYDSFSIVNKTGITVDGAGAGQTIIQPTTLIDTHTGHKYTADMKASVFVNGSTNVVLENMTVNDNGQAPGSGGPDALVFWNASSGNITDVNVTATYPINGVQSGQGIAVDAGSGQTSNLTITDGNISGTQKNGIDAEDGNSQSSGNSGTISIDVEGSTITGAGPTSAIAQNGIVVWNEGGGTVTGKVNGAKISGFDYTGAGATAAGVLAYGGGQITTIRNTSFTNNPQYSVSTNSAAAPAIDATQNYWGSVSGPATSSIDSNVSFSPWFTDPAMTNLQFTTATSTATTTTTTGSATTTETASTGSGTTTVAIAPDTTITGNASWDGTFNAANSVSATSVTVTPDSGDTATVVEAIEIGSPTQSLTLSNAARIDFAGVAGDLVGWTINGTFTPITAICTADDQTTENTNLAAGADCKMTVGSDLVVWTKHFTTFEVYTEAAIPSTPAPVVVSSGGGNGPIAGGGGGGAGPVPVALPFNGGAPTTGTTVTTTGGSTGSGQVLGASVYNFTTNLSIGSTGPDVTALQQFLIAQGYSIPLLASGQASYGYFGAQTRAAVAAYQKANDITPAVGYVGPITRALLNQGVTPTSAQEKASVLASLEAQLQSLEAQIAAMTSTTSSMTMIPATTTTTTY